MVFKNKKNGIYFSNIAGAIIILFLFCSHKPPVSPLEPNAERFSIGGKITAKGSAASNVEVTLAGEKSAATRTDSLGRYVFSSLGTGLYSLTPKMSGFNFNPQVIQLELADTSLSGENFSMIPLGPNLLPLKKEIDFGDVFINQSVRILLGLSNLGKAELAITRFVFTDSSFNVEIPKTAGPVDSVSARPDTLIRANYRVKSANLVISPDGLVYLPVIFAPTDSGRITAQMMLLSNDPSNPITYIGLSGTGITKGKPMVAADSLNFNFGTIQIGSSKTARLTLTNTGSDTLHLKSISVSNDAFRVTEPGYALLIGQKAQIEITFAPADTGNFKAQLNIVTDAANSPSIVASLSGSGTRPLPSGIKVNPESFDFGRVFLDSSAVREIDIQNNGSDTLLVTAFKFSDTMFSSPFTGNDLIGPGKNKKYQIFLQAGKKGAFQAILTIYNSDPKRTTLDVPLQVLITEVPPFEIRVNPATLSFGDLPVGSSLTKGFWVVNPNQVPLVVSRISTDVPGIRIETDSMVIARSDSSLVVLTFSPLTVGTFQGGVILRTNVLGKDTMTVSISGKGIQQENPAMSLSVETIDFGSISLGDSSASIVKVRNAGKGALVISRLETDNQAFLIQNETVVVNPDLYHNIDVIFKPVKVNIEKGSLFIYCNDPNLPIGKVSLSGIGIDTSGLAPLMILSTRTLDVGQVIVQLTGSAELDVTNVGKDTLRVLDIHFSDPEFKVDPRRFQVPPGGSEPVTVSFTPSSTGLFTGTMVIFSNDQVRERDSITVRGEGIPSQGVIGENEIFVEGGVFMMGDDGQVEARPKHLVTISSFYMDAYEVTNSEFKEFMDAGGYNRRDLWTAEGWNWRITSREQNFNPSDPKPMSWGSGSNPWESDLYSNNSDTPVVGINWYEAYAYARFRGKSLPAEAQWEYAARDRNGRTYPWGYIWNGSYANHGQDHTPYDDASDGYLYTAPVKSFPEGATQLEIYNLAGNVWEWCLDWYGSYNSGDQVDPRGAEGGTEKCIRGGSWRGSTLFCRSFHRNHSQPQLRYKDGGIRLVRNY